MARYLLTVADEHVPLLDRWLGGRLSLAPLAVGRSVPVAGLDRALPELRWAPYREFGIPDPAEETHEPPACPVVIRATGYRGQDIIAYWQEKTGG